MNLCRNPTYCIARGILERKRTIDQSTELTLTEGEDKTKTKIRASISKTGPKAGMAAEAMQAGFTQQFEKLNDFLSPKK